LGSFAVSIAGTAALKLCPLPVHTFRESHGRGIQPGWFLGCMLEKTHASGTPVARIPRCNRPRLQIEPFRFRSILDAPGLPWGGCWRGFAALLGRLGGQLKNAVAAFSCSVLLAGFARLLQGLFSLVLHWPPRQQPARRMHGESGTRAGRVLGYERPPVCPREALGYSLPLIPPLRLAYVIGTSRTSD
jgi:hypothetical protein